MKKTKVAPEPTVLIAIPIMEVLMTNVMYMLCYTFLKG